ncbi:MAG: hypothetical protein ACYDHD_03575 [Vulcanimicrobiaceae bacterium]
MKPLSNGVLAVAAFSLAGLALGMLVGLSVSPIVGIVVAGMASIVATVFAVGKANLSHLSDLSKRLQFLSLLALALGLLLGAPAGLFARTHELFSPTLEAQASQIKVIEALPDALARRLILYREFGVDTGAPTDHSTALGQWVTRSVVKGPMELANGTPAWQCHKASPDSSVPTARLLMRWDTLGVRWKTISKLALKQPPSQQRAFIAGAWAERCSLP